MSVRMCMYVLVSIMAIEINKNSIMTSTRGERERGAESSKVKTVFFHSRS